MRITRKTLIRELKEIFIIALVGALFNFLTSSFTVLNVAVSVTIWVSLSKGNGYIVDYLNTKISWVEKPITRITVGMVCMMAYTIFTFGAVIVLFKWWNSNSELLDLIRNIRFQDFIIAILITLIISMFFHGRAFYINWKEALFKVEKLKNESLKSQYESLRNQVNPHFLFNSLNVLSELVYEDQGKAVEFIRKMSDVYRYVLEHKDQEMVPLDVELAFLTSYGFLQKIRFGDNFDLSIEKNGEGMVPPLALQMLVENAIKHNVVSSAKPLRVEIVISDDTVMVRNNVQEKLTKDSTGIGLSNLKARYQYLSDQEVVISNDQKTFEVTLPLLKMKR